jgi:hypothetical protein
MTHYLKTWPEYFAAIDSGSKTFEIRKNDRGFQRGDILILEEYNPDTKEYSGHKLSFRVGFMIEGAWGIPAGTCVMSLLPI